MTELDVTPVGDLIEHDLSDDCVCGPDVNFVEGGTVVVHHSLDGRERWDDLPRRKRLRMLERFRRWLYAAS
jgi:hypothetical protein